MTGSRPGVPWASARLLRVTAALAQGAALGPRWPLPLDGLLASAARRARHGEAYGGLADQHAEDLPLALLTAGCGARWCWLASCADPGPDAAEDLHYWHRRVPHAAAERACGSLLPPVIYEGHGRYRAHRTPLPVTVTPSLTWMAAGDPAAVQALLSGVWCAGKKRSQGEGVVMSWQVTDLGQLTGAGAWLVLRSAAGAVSRPVPSRAAGALGLDAPPETVAGCYRPPYWRPPQDGAPGPWARRWQEVIAPWTTLPSTPPSSFTSGAPARA